MKIAHCIASIDKNAGGTTTACIDLIKQLKNRVENIHLYTIKSENPVDCILENGKVLLADSRFLGYSNELRIKLNILDVDIFHGHGIWNLSIHQMAKVSRERKLPYIISVHGMLEPWSLKQAILKKRIAMTLYQHIDLQKATCLHGTAYMEAKNIRELGYTNPIAVIPNGIDLSQYPLKENVIVKEKRKILFLSRIHYKKGIENLINAWEKLDENLRENWQVDIAGNGDSHYIAQLIEQIKEKSLQNEIKIIGAKFGAEKIATYHSADLFVLPTHSENFGIVIAEALACGVPVITTKGTPWEELESYNAGKWIDIGELPLKEALNDLMEKKDEDLALMGQNGRRLIEENYSIESVAKKMVELYNWILKGVEKPDFVYI